MALDIGLGGGGRPVPTTNKPPLPPRPIPTDYIDPALAGHVDYVPPTSTGAPHQIEIFVADETPPQYSSVARVVQAYLDRATTGLTYYRAHQILMSQFGLSENDATDALGVEAEVIVNPPIVLPIEEPQDSVEVSPVSEPIYEMGPQVGGVTMVRIVGIAVLYYALAALNRKW